MPAPDPREPQADRQAPAPDEAWWPPVRLDEGPPNAATLLALLRGEPPERWPAPESAQALLDLAVHHRLHLELEHALAGAAPAAPAWAAALEPELRAWKAHTRVEWVYKREAAEAFGRELERAGARALAFKGLALAWRVYPSPDRRAYGDLDLFVAPRERALAEAALAACGFRAAPAPQPFGDFQKVFLKDTGHGVSLVVDLHWAFVSPETLVRSLRPDLEAILARGEAVAPGLIVPAAEDALLLAAVNLARDGFAPLSHYLDVRYLLKQGVDWAALEVRVEAARTRTAMALALNLGDSLLGLELPPEAAVLRRHVEWKRVLFQRLLRPADTLTPGWNLAPRARYLLKVLANDGLGSMLGACMRMPLGLVRRWQHPHAVSANLE
ncbi:MAG: nucleotidyltransferase family protein [Planctomycetota bacterium]|nr:nucleotidyltransferase family protein [Planctomycetota bacterium]